MPGDDAILVSGQRASPLLRAVEAPDRGSGGALPVEVPADSSPNGHGLVVVEPGRKVTRPRSVRSRSSVAPRQLKQAPTPQKRAARRRAKHRRASTPKVAAPGEPGLVRPVGPPQPGDALRTDRRASDVIDEEDPYL